MTHVNDFTFRVSAHAAALLLNGQRAALPTTVYETLSAGEAERLELVETIAVRLQYVTSISSIDELELAVCQRLLEHLRGPETGDMAGLCLQ
jgi:hypothetical protein